MIHQSRGTGVGQWEINLIVSGAGSTTLTLDKALSYTYTDSGASQAQCVLMSEWTTFNPSNTFTTQRWDGNDEGIAAFAVSESMDLAELFNATGKGYSSQGNGSNAGDNTSFQGEGSTGAGADGVQTANGNGGGGVTGGGDGGPGGGGGGHASSGTQGGNGQGTGGAGGNAVGSADLTTMFMGGEGGGGRGELNGVGNGGNGGNGGGIVIIFAKNADFSYAGGYIASDGDNGSNGSGATDDGAGGGGGGAGGSILICCESGLFPFGLLAEGYHGGTHAGSTSGDGGEGSDGIIAIHYGRSLSQSGNIPEPTTQQDNDFIFGGGLDLTSNIW